MREMTAPTGLLPDTSKAGWRGARHASGRRRSSGRFGLGLLGNTAAVICAVYVFAAIFGTSLIHYGAGEITGAAPFLRPTAKFPFGTDSLGRSEFSRIVVASRVAILAAVESVALALVVGGAMGVVAGYVGGIVDEVLSRIMDFLFSVPAYLLGIVVIVVLGPGLTHASLAIGLVFVPQFGRIARTATMGVRQRAYIEVAHLSKRPTWWIILHHVIPNIAGPMSVMVGLQLSNAEGAYAVLSFLGYGARPPAPDYGSMLGDAQTNLTSDPWLVFFPSAAIVILILGFVLLGDWMRERADPHGRILSRGVSQRSADNSIG